MRDGIRKGVRDRLPARCAIDRSMMAYLSRSSKTEEEKLKKRIAGYCASDTHSGGCANIHVCCMAGLLSHFSKIYTIVYTWVRVKICANMCVTHTCFPYTRHATSIVQSKHQYSKSKLSWARKAVQRPERPTER